MRIGRRSVVILAVAAGAAAIAGIAMGAANGDSSSLQGSKFMPSTLPKDTYKAGSLFVHTHAHYANPGNANPGGATERAQLFFDDDGKLNTTGIPRCDPASVGSGDMAHAMSVCGTAKVGAGKAQAITNGGALLLNGCVLVFNGKPTASGQPTSLVFTRVNVANPSTITCDNPASNHQGNTTVLLKGVVKPNPTSLGGDFAGGKQVDYNHITSVAAFPLTDFQVTVKKGSYVSARCHDTDHRLNIKGKFTYNDGQFDIVGTSQACTVG
jgi:hypothetical protein